MPFLSAGEYLAQARLRVCGDTGPQGPAGPAGPQGPSGLSTGAIYYFKLSQSSGASLTTPMDPTTDIGSMGKIPGSTTAVNTYYSASPQYLGYFTQVVGPSTAPILISQFDTLTGDPGVTTIPAGVWSFYINAYSFTQQSPPTVPPTLAVQSSIYVTLSSYDGVTETLIATSGNSTIPGLTDSSPILLGLNVPSTTINVTDTLRVKFYVSQNVASGDAIEFWTEGDSVSYVVTTLSPGLGPTGDTGATGYTGDTGPAGPPGTNGINGAPGTYTGVQNGIAYFDTPTNVTSTSTLTTDGISISAPNGKIMTGVAGPTYGTTTPLTNTTGLIDFNNNYGLVMGTVGGVGKLYIVNLGSPGASYYELTTTMIT